MNCAISSLLKFQFSYLHLFYKVNNIKTKSSLKVKSYFQIYLDEETNKYFTLGPHGPKGWRKDGKTFVRCYTIALKFGDEFNVNFLLHFSHYRSFLKLQVNKNLTALLHRCGEKYETVHLRLLFTYFHQNLFNIKKHISLVLKKCVHVLFCVFQTNLNNGQPKNKLLNCKLIKNVANPISTSTPSPFLSFPCPPFWQKNLVISQSD